MFNGIPALLLMEAHKASPHVTSWWRFVVEQSQESSDVALSHLKSLVFRQLFVLADRRNDVTKSIECDVQIVHATTFARVCCQTTQLPVRFASGSIKDVGALRAVFWCFAFWLRSWLLCVVSDCDVTVVATIVLLMWWRTRTCTCRTDYALVCFAVWYADVISCLW